LTLIIAHRGASAYEPENSIAAFAAAARLGADGVELDVHDTADGAFIVHHDGVFGAARADRLSLSAIREHRLANAEPVPTLSEALAVLPLAMLVFVELKTLRPQHDDALLDALASGPAPEHYHLHSFDHRLVRRLLRGRRALVGGILSASYPVDPVSPLANAEASELWQRENLVDEELVRSVHDAGARVYAWTVDDRHRIRELAGMGVDGVCSNRPDTARRALG
jgi:glycerophosphoryl diester phosphodiesterase